jgi:hypothetical protein
MRTTRTQYEAVTAYGQPITTFETVDQAETWERSNTFFPGARVESVTTTVVRLPIRPTLRLVTPTAASWRK